MDLPKSWQPPAAGLPTCPYCEKLSARVTGEFVYPHRRDLWEKVFYVCEPCDARIGCHPGTEIPLGRMANPELRFWKQQAHAAFDPMWKGTATRRGFAYTWLAAELGIAAAECHIGMFDVARCKRTIEVCAIWAQGRELCR